jgi:hypothetical protein
MPFFQKGKTKLDEFKRLWETEQKFPALTIGFSIFLLTTVGILIYAAVAFFGADNNYASFIMSLAASFLEDAVFFLLIGAIAIFLSIKDPAKDPIDKRIKWLFNGSKFHQNALSYARDRIVDLAIYSPIHTVAIKFVEELNPERNALKIHVHSRRKFANLMFDVAHTRFIHEYRAIPDLVYDDRHNGELITVFRGIGTSKVSLLDLPTKIPHDGLKVRELLSIEANGETEFEHSFWVWHKIGEAFFFDAVQYTAEVNVSVKNDTKHRIVLEDLRENRKKELTSGEVVVYTYTDVPAATERPFRLVEVME